MDMIILAIVLGAAFGIALDRIGATNPGYIISMLNFSNLHLMKTILLAIGVASILLFAGMLIGIVDPGHMSVKTAHIGVLIGGMLLGVGFAIAGYCPGTGLTAAATGRLDAVIFVIGGLLGAAAYMVSYESVAATGVLADIAGGKTTLGQVSGTNYTSLLGGISGEWIGMAMGILFIVVASLLPDRLSKPKALAPAE